ncbi:hypothetical protein F2P81_026424 [Scophthalmus maximus]|uniref:Uncharacterized protein n=1 Tax=Scophthalmus maximus TaxID=52904 RepID=A0A6A4RHJ7_SCOMX|nr:hypothetical protein F2P81_026424 [Scophthalmus maximus]
MLGYARAVKGSGLSVLLLKRPARCSTSNCSRCGGSVAVRNVVPRKSEDRHNVCRNAAPLPATEESPPAHLNNNCSTDS